METEPQTIKPEEEYQESEYPQPPRQVFIYSIIFVLGLGSGYLFWGRNPIVSPQTSQQPQSILTTGIKEHFWGRG